MHYITPDRQPCQHPTTHFFTGRTPFLLPNQQRQSTEGRWSMKKILHVQTVKKQNWFADTFSGHGFIFHAVLNQLRQSTFIRFFTPVDVVKQLQHHR